MIHVGMSGFSYPEWIGEVYPPGTKRADMLSSYAQIFPVVEINMSFRRVPTESTIERWRDAVGESFIFTMKANQRITHWKRLVDVTDDVAGFVRVCQGLGAKLGPILFQVPPSLVFDTGVLDAFGTSLVPGCAYALEPRDESFFGPEASDMLRRHGIALCLNDDFFEPARYTQTGPFAYFRFHRDVYGPGDLEARAEIVQHYAAGGADVYAIFQHEDNPESVKPALRFLELVS
jgi:uncharacterized protein YecE (DUF72 family)